MRRSNLTTLRNFFDWNTSWYSDTYYLKLVFKDLILMTYLTSVFKILQFPTSSFLIQYNSFNYLIVTCDIYVPSLFYIKNRISEFEKKYFYFFSHINNLLSAEDDYIPFTFSTSFFSKLFLNFVYYYIPKSKNVSFNRFLLKSLNNFYKRAIIIYGAI